MLRMMLFFILWLSRVKKFFLLTNKICVGLGSKLKLDVGLGHGPKVIDKDLKNSLYFMPWT